MNKEVLITTFGAVPDGKTNNSRAIQAAIDQVSNGGGGKVVVPTGIFMSGSFQLKANVNFHLSKDAKIVASGDYADYLPEHSVDSVTEGEVTEDVLPRRALIVAFKAHNVRITGEGEINGNADEFILERGQYIHSMRGPENGRSQYLERPFTIFIIESHNILLEDFTLKDPAFWAIRATGCKNLVIDHINILTDLMVPNADGIDIDRCQNVQILNCNLVTADDSISLKSCAGTSQYGVLEDVLIANTYMKSTSGAITLGTEACGDIRNVLVTDCVVEDSHRGFAVRPREGGTVSNVLFTKSKISTRTFSESWWGHGEALHVTASSWDDADRGTDGNQERLLDGKVDGVRFSQLDVHTEAGVLVWAKKSELIKNVEFNNVTITLDNSSKWPARIDLRPNGVQDFIFEPHSALSFFNAESISVSDVKVVWDEQTKSRYKSALEVVNVKNLVKHNFEFVEPS